MPSRSRSEPRAGHTPSRSSAASVEHQRELDAELEGRAVGWTLARMPVVDRAILRLAAWELRHNPEVPTAVVIAEALEFATVLSTEESASFVNGVLGAVAEAVRA